MAAATGPKLVVSEETWDLGTMAPGPVVEHVFTIHNAGTDDLVIGNVKATCKCIAAISWPKLVPAGGKGEIKVSLKTEKRSGPYKKLLVIESNDPLEPVKKIEIVGVFTAPSL
ncbi:MAG: DUF1573 domain-containing protein [Chitinophagales bacterium]